MVIVVKHAGADVSTLLGPARSGLEDDVTVSGKLKSAPGLYGVVRPRLKLHRMQNEQIVIGGAIGRAVPKQTAILDDNTYGVRLAMLIPGDECQTYQRNFQPHGDAQTRVVMVTRKAAQWAEKRVANRREGQVRAYSLPYAPSAHTGENSFGEWRALLSSDKEDRVLAKDAVFPRPSPTTERPETHLKHVPMVRLLAFLADLQRAAEMRGVTDDQFLGTESMFQLIAPPGSPQPKRSQAIEGGTLYTLQSKTDEGDEILRQLLRTKAHADLLAHLTVVTPIEDGVDDEAPTKTTPALSDH